jgi:hypothetical protein
MMLAAVVRSELAAVFLLIMTSFIDLGLQNPIANTDAANPVLSVLPAYGAMQSAVTSVGLHLLPSSYLTLGMCWAVGTAATGIMAFALSTHSRGNTNTTAWAGLFATDDRATVESAVLRQAD